MDASSWKCENNTAIRQSPEQLTFYKSLLQKFSATEQCIIHLLYLDGTAIAGQFGLIEGTTLYLLKISYSADYHSSGPGCVLLDETIRFFSGQENIKHISFVTGAKWNDDWDPKIDRVYFHYIYNRNFFGLLGCLLQFGKNFLREIKHFNISHYRAHTE